MNQSPTNNNLWLFLELLARRRGLIVLLVVVATLVSIVVCLVMPVWYRATTVLLPPKDISLPAAGLGNLSELFSATEGLNLPVQATQSDVLARMMKSKTITSRIIEEFSLKERYGASNFEEAYNTLMKLSLFKVTDEGLLEVSFEDREAQMSADITNAFVEELDKLNREISSERTKQTREFLENRFEQISNELDSARAAFQAFQLEFKAIDFDQQTRVTIEQAILLKVALTDVELQLQVNEALLGGDNADLVDLRRRRDIIRRQLIQLEVSNVDSSFFSLPIAAIPELKGRWQVLYSRVQVAEALHKVLLEQLERVKIKQFEDMPTISVLDRAEPPEVKSRPQRRIIVMGTFGLSIVFAIILAAVLEYFVRLKESRPSDYQRAMLFVNAFLGWFPGIRKRSQS